MIPESLFGIGNHLWQSTLFAGAAGLLTLALRKNRARVRHWVWVAASVKFLVPFSLLVAAGSQVHWRTTAVSASMQISSVIDQVSHPFQYPALAPTSPLSSPARTRPLPPIPGTVWAIGFIGIACSWWIRWRRIRAAIRAGSPLDFALPIRAASSPSFTEPGVFGILRPVLLLPDGLLQHLAPEQWKSVLAHELCHIRNRDNLIGAVQMFVETVFWFHPLVWWIGKRIHQERERACDEEVVQMGNDRRTYAQGILKICELYLQSPLACVSGITGSNLTKRIEAILENPAPAALRVAGKGALAASAAACVIVPLLFGLVHAPVLRAQSILTVAPGEAHPAFEVASVKQLDQVARPGQPDVAFVGTAGNPFRIAGNRVAIRGNLHSLAADAFALKTYQIFGLPAWADLLIFDITAQSPGTNTPTQDQARLMLQSLLRDRFQLQFHPDSKEMPVYHLVRNRPSKFFKQADADETFRWQVTPEGEWQIRSKATKESIGDFVRLVGVSADRPVVDKTGMEGFIDYEIIIEMPGANPAGENRIEGQSRAPVLRRDFDSAIVDAVQDQLGLKLEPTRDKVDIVVVDHVDHPSEN